MSNTQEKEILNNLKIKVEELFSKMDEETIKLKKLRLQKIACPEKEVMFDILIEEQKLNIYKIYEKYIVWNDKLKEREEKEKAESFFYQIPFVHIGVFSLIATVIAYGMTLGLSETEGVRYSFRTANIMLVSSFSLMGFGLYKGECGHFSLGDFFLGLGIIILICII